MGVSRFALDGSGLCRGVSLLHLPGELDLQERWWSAFGRCLGDCQTAPSSFIIIHYPPSSYLLFHPLIYSVLLFFRATRPSSFQILNLQVEHPTIVFRPRIQVTRTSTRPRVKLLQNCHRRTFQTTHKISSPGSLTLRINSNEHWATTRATWHAQSDERVAWAISTCTPRHNESDPGGARWREVCASTCAAKSIIESLKAMVLPRFEKFLYWGLQSTAPATKNELETEASEVLRLPGGINIMYRNKIPNIAPAAKKSFQNHVLFRSTLANALAKTRKYTMPATRMKKCPMSCACCAKQRSRLQTRSPTETYPKKNIAQKRASRAGKSRH